MTLALPAALVFLLLVAATIKYAAHKPGHALIAFLAGFFVASTAAAPTIDHILTSLAHAAGRM